MTHQAIGQAAVPVTVARDAGGGGSCQFRARDDLDPRVYLVAIDTVQVGMAARRGERVVEGHLIPSLQDVAGVALTPGIMIGRMATGAGVGSNQSVMALQAGGHVSGLYEVRGVDRGVHYAHMAGDAVLRFVGQVREGVVPQSHVNREFVAAPATAVGYLASDRQWGFGLAGDVHPDLPEGEELGLHPRYEPRRDVAVDAFSLGVR